MKCKWNVYKPLGFEMINRRIFIPVVELGDNIKILEVLNTSYAMLPHEEVYNATDC